MRKITVITGIAPHSFGASFVRLSLQEKPEAPIIGIDRIRNQELEKQSRLSTILCDLNPLTFDGGYKTYTEMLASGLSTAVRSFGNAPIGLLVQSAGTYEFGPFTSHELNRRKRVLGLNLLGITEVLYVVMTLNHQRNEDNSRVLTHVIIGSLQALDTRGERTIYAASKAYGLDLSAGLMRGNELAKCFYLALGPMDTAMLHWNHWTAKTGGSDRFFQSVFAGDPVIYKSVFIDCDEDALIAAASPKFLTDLPSLVLKLKEYRLIRKQALNSELGVLAPDLTANLLLRVLSTPELHSGIYSLTCPKGKLLMKMATFEEISRKQLFESIGKEILLK
jgi:NADP-dependent 3-hydroxy acid dehydrogenase YdfG